MLPPEQENTSIKGSSSTNNNPSDSISVQIERPSLSSNVSPCPDNRMSEKDRAARVRFSVLRESLHPVTLKFEDVSYTINLQNKQGFFCSSSQPKLTRKILNNVSGTVKPGELLAMLGPSGSGKTTLLTALAGRLPGKISGSIKYNGRAFSSSTKRKTGFVTQDDVLYPHLTVLETLTYTALLKLPSTLSKKDKMDQAEMIIVELGLTRCRNSVIGGPLLRGISGGERKRVSIGQEMLVNPSLLLVDEPTSGLDSTTAQRIVATLRWAARGGRTVVTTIHQPSSRLFRMFDKVIVLSEGCPIYCGSANGVMDYFGSIGYMPGFDFINPADFLLDLANGVTPDSRHDDQIEFHGREDHHDDLHSTKQFLIYSYKKNLHPLINEEIHKGSHDQPHSGKSLPSRSIEKQWTNSWWLQFKVLLSRGLKERKHESYSGLRIFQVMSVAIISGLLWWHSDANHIQDQRTFLWNVPSLILLHRTNNWRLTNGACSPNHIRNNCILDGWPKTFPRHIPLDPLGRPPQCARCTESRASPWRDSNGRKTGTTLSSVLMLVFLLASGYYIQHIPPFIDWLKYVSFSQYCYRLLVGVQYSDNDVYDCGLGSVCRVVDFPAIKYLGVHNMGVDVVALVMMLVGYRVLAYVALRFGKHC
ncbi:hypothetical protein DH2020_032200 [Rehmannia glutinosa]|uniref:ABC transporter domain-containing protein n=1 Tax=Rehmannia glutinosa TaxID=99300 RepID=A0ABR0VI76_REHGL